MQNAARNTASCAWRKYAVAIAVAAIMAFAMAVVPGCSQQTSTLQAEQKVTASDYMVSLNQSASDLSGKLSDFAAAVAASDVPTMQAKADAAFAVLDQMSSLEAPENLSELKDKYNAATESLKTALNDYLKLYLEIENEPEGASINYDDYAVRIESVQKEYDEGLNLLEEADKMASEL